MLLNKIKELLGSKPKYDFSSVDSIKRIPIPTYKPLQGLSSPVDNIEYILQRKATEFKKMGRMDLAIACLEKSNEIMPFSNFSWSAKDYYRLVKYLKADGQHERALREEEKLKSRFPELFDGVNVANPQIKKINTDLIHFTGSRLCPLCSIYSGRTFSRSGRDKRFPAFSVFPEELKNVNCPECGIFLGFTPYHVVDAGNKLRDEIKKSNAPFVDSRNAELKKIYFAHKEEAEFKAKSKAEYDLVSKVLPNLAPKSLSGYSRMKSGNTKNYQKIVETMRNSGYPTFAENENITKEI